MLSDHERQQVEDAIRAAEAGTAGEIVVVVARQAASYRSVPLVACLIAAMLAPPLLIWLSEWSAARIFAAQLGVAVATLGIFAAAPGPRWAPEPLKRRRGREAAAREFVARGLSATTGRTGVLIYIAVAERYAEVIGDIRISERIGEAAWRVLLTDLVEALHAGRAADGLVEAVGQVGRLLAEQLPRGEDDRDELPNRVILL